MRNALELTRERVFQAEGTGHTKVCIRKSGLFEELKYTRIDWDAGKIVQDEAQQKSRDQTCLVALGTQ